MSKRLPNSRVCSTVGGLRMRITYDSCNHEHSGARSVMSLQSLFAEDITVKFIAVATKPLGGTRPVLTRLPPPALSG